MRRSEDTFSSSGRQLHCGDHEIFDQLGGRILLLLGDVNDLFIQDDRMHFVGVDVQSSVGEPLFL